MLERLKVSLVARYLWELFPSLKNAQIASFADTEFTTSWQFRFSLPHLSSPEKRARMFEQLLEEYHHADIFLKLARSRSARPVFLEPAEIKPIYSEPSDVWKLIVYSHVGEQSAVDRFSALAAATADPELKRVIYEVLADEKGHTESVKDMAFELGRTPAEIEALSRRVRVQRAWAAWLRIGTRFTEHIGNMVLSAVYFVFGPLLVFQARRRLRERLRLREDMLKRAV